MRRELCISVCRSDIFQRRRCVQAWDGVEVDRVWVAIIRSLVRAFGSIGFVPAVARWMMDRTISAGSYFFDDPLTQVANAAAHASRMSDFLLALML